MKYYRNGQQVKDMAPSCTGTSIKDLAARKGIDCSWCEDRVLLFNDSIAVEMPGVPGIVQFIYNHFGAKI